METDWGSLSCGANGEAPHTQRRRASHDEQGTGLNATDTCDAPDANLRGLTGASDASVDTCGDNEPDQGNGPCDGTAVSNGVDDTNRLVFLSQE